MERKNNRLDTRMNKQDIKTQDGYHFEFFLSFLFFHQ